MFITPDAGLIIRKKRREQILERLVLDLVKEARLLDIPESEIISMIKDALNRE